MAKRVNYGFEKRQREMRKEKKNAEKAERKRQEAASADEPGKDALEGRPLGPTGPDRA